MNRQSSALCSTRRGRRRGFALVDVLVTAAVLSVLAALVVAPLTHRRNRTRLARCTSNLQQIGRAVLAYAEDHRQTLPTASADLGGEMWWWYKEDVKRYAGLTGPSSPQDALFACPEDRGYSDPTPFHRSRRFDFNSYPFNGVTLPGVPSLAGWALPSVRQPKRTLLVMEWTAHAPLSWHKSRTGRKNAPFYSDAQSVVGFVDGHVSFCRIYYDGYNPAFTRDPIPGYEYQYSGQ